MENIAIIGCSGHAHVLKDAIESSKKYCFMGFVGKENGGGVYYSDADLGKLRKDRVFNLACGVGNISYPWFESMIARYRNEGFIFPVIIHERSVVSKSSTVGMGTAVLENAVVKADAKIGSFSTINSLAVVSHDCEIADYAHISLGAKIGGGCRVGKNSFLGINSSVIEGKNIGNNVIIGAGAVIIEDVPDNVVVAGNPGRIIKKR